MRNRNSKNDIDGKDDISDNEGINDKDNVNDRRNINVKDEYMNNIIDNRVNDVRDIASDVRDDERGYVDFVYISEEVYLCSDDPGGYDSD